jgi:hypothetical protein
MGHRGALLGADGPRGSLKPGPTRAHGSRRFRSDRVFKWTGLYVPCARTLSCGRFEL